MDSYRKCGKCKNILNSYGINDRKSFHRWSVTGGHPDKGGDYLIFQEVSSCNDMFGKEGLCNWNTDYRYAPSPPRRPAPAPRTKPKKAKTTKSKTTKAKPKKAGSKDRKPCKSNQYRNPETGRCKKKESRKPCKEGEYRHPETGRCRKIRRPTSSRPPREKSPRTGLKPCKEGYARNMETRRCRKIRRSRRSRRRTRSRSRRRSRKYSRRY